MKYLRNLVFLGAITVGASFAQQMPSPNGNTGAYGQPTCNSSIQSCYVVMNGCTPAMANDSALFVGFAIPEIAYYVELWLGWTTGFFPN